MIKQLNIQNYAIIEELHIDFPEGLTIITGETGAGKSILLGALGLIMGKRADTKSLYDDSKKCIIEAVFEVGKYKLRAFFDNNDIDYDEEVVVRRELTPTGKSRAFVNDTPVNLKLLQQLSSSLIDLHQQFDTLDIHNVSFQLRMLDALADNQLLLDKYQTAFRQLQTDRKKLIQLIEQNDSAAKEIDYINFQLDEFGKVELVAGEQVKMEEELATLTNAESIKNVLSAAYIHLCEDEQAVVNQLQEVAYSLGEIKGFSSELNSIFERYEGLILELQDLGEDFEKIADNTEYDAESIAEMQVRLDQIYRLQNKHQVKSVEELLDIQDALQQKLDSFGDMGDEIAKLEKAIDAQEKSLVTQAKKLHTRRQSVVKNFETKVHEMLRLLSMEHARLKIEITKLKELTPTGMDEVNYLFAANMGSRLQLIKDVASGGELSRLTLITKSLVASAIPLPTLIFDEIDAGVSGDVAIKMGDILRRLSNQHQVISITHSPQIASKADKHFFVYKKVKEKRTVTNVRELEMEERVRAIATMLSQNPPSNSAIENARELLSVVS